MIQPIAADTIADAVRMGVEVFAALKKGLPDAGHNTNVGVVGEVDRHAVVGSCARAEDPPRRSMAAKIAQIIEEGYFSAC